jgi:hypothetical protein
MNLGLLFVSTARSIAERVGGAQEKLVTPGNKATVRHATICCNKQASKPCGMPFSRAHPFAPISCASCLSMSRFVPPCCCSLFHFLRGENPRNLEKKKRDQGLILLGRGGKPYFTLSLMSIKRPADDSPMMEPQGAAANVPAPGLPAFGADAGEMVPLVGGGMRFGALVPSPFFVNEWLVTLVGGTLASRSFPPFTPQLFAPR